jgi:hypothetical protein
MSPIRADRKKFYPPEWKQISYRIRFVRAEGRCECTGECGIDHGGRCTAVHGLPHPVNGKRVVLTTAHLNHIESDCRDENLAGMCQWCHLAYDREHHVATRRARTELDTAIAVAQMVLGARVIYGDVYQASAGTGLAKEGENR